MLGFSQFYVNLVQNMLTIVFTNDVGEAGFCLYPLKSFSAGPDN